MKQYQYRFEKVLTYREMEKNKTENEFKTAVQEFEDIATLLYDILKKKEDVLLEQQEKMTAGFSVHQMHHYARFIESTEKKINELQQQVIRARSKMNWFEEKLLEKTLEVRKFEKMKEKDHEQYRTETEHLEAVQLDEMTTLKFRKKENGW